MKAKVSPLFTELLHNRIYLARNVKVFTLEQVAEGWEVSKQTLIRYESPRAREISRIVAKRFTDSQKGKDKSLCKTCGVKLIGHPRCKDCEMLYHGVKECSCGVCIDINQYDTLMIQIYE